MRIVGSTMRTALFILAGVAGLLIAYLTLSGMVSPLLTVLLVMGYFATLAIVADRGVMLRSVTDRDGSHRASSRWKFLSKSVLWLVSGGVWAIGWTAVTHYGVILETPIVGAILLAGVIPSLLMWSYYMYKAFFPHA